jgi:hypothetical protein
MAGGEGSVYSDEMKAPKESCKNKLEEANSVLGEPRIYCTFISILIIVKHEIHTDNFSLGAGHYNRLQNGYKAT